MGLKIGRKTSTALYFVFAALLLLLKLGSPHFSMFSPVDAAAISYDVASVIEYAAAIGLIFCGIRRLRQNDNSN